MTRADTQLFNTIMIGLLGMAGFVLWAIGRGKEEGSRRQNHAGQTIQESDALEPMSAEEAERRRQQWVASQRRINFSTAPVPVILRYVASRQARKFIEKRPARVVELYGLATRGGTEWTQLTIERRTTPIPLKNVVMAADPETGEVIDDLAGWLCRKGPSGAG